MLSACKDNLAMRPLGHGSRRASRISSNSGAPALCDYHLNSVGRRVGYLLVGATMETRKRCSKCGIEKALSEFYKDSRTPSGLHYWCKECMRLYRRAWHRKHPDAINARVRARREANPEKRREQARRSYRRNLDVARVSQRGYRKRHKERGLAHAAVQSSKLLRQACEICGATEGVHAHHADYSKPLEVRWLCATHHQRLHRGHFCLLSMPKGRSHEIRR